MSQERTMTAKYIPQSDTGMATWARNFSDIVGVSPGAYGLMASDAAQIASVVGQFTSALTLALEPMTRTMPAVEKKNGMRAAMLDTVRFYAQTIKRNRAVSNAAKVALGLHIDLVGTRPIGAPISQPVIMIVQTLMLQHMLHFKDITWPEGRAKPYGVKGLMVFLSVGDAPPESMDLMPLYGVATRQPFAVQFNAADSGKTAYYAGRWINNTGQMGPWSSVVERRVA